MVFREGTIDTRWLLHQGEDFGAAKCTFVQGKVNFLSQHWLTCFQLPVLVYVYGGPGESMVTNEFDIGWEQFMVTNRSVAVVYIDGRGSAFGSNHQALISLYKIFIASVT